MVRVQKNMDGSERDGHSLRVSGCVSSAAKNEGRFPIGECALLCCLLMITAATSKIPPWA